MANESNDYLNLKKNLTKILSDDELHDLDNLFDQSITQGSNDKGVSFSAVAKGRDSVRKISALVESLEMKRSKLELKVSKLAQESLKQDKLINELTLKRESLVSEILLKEKEFSRIERSLQFRNEKFKIIDSEIGRLEKNKAVLQEALVKIEARRNDVFKNILVQRTEEEKLVERVKELKVLVEQLEQTRYNIEESVLKIEETLSESVQKYVTEISLQLNKLNDYRRQVIAAEHQVKSKIFEISEKSNLLLFKNAEVGKLDRDIENRKKTLANMELEKSTLQFRIDRMREAEKKKTFQLQELTLQNENMQLKFSKLENALANLLSSIKHEYETVNHLKGNAYNEYSKYEHSLGSLKENIEKAKADFDVVRDSILQAEKEREEYGAKLEKLISLERTLADRLGLKEEEIDLDEQSLEQRSREIIKEKEVDLSSQLLKLQEALKTEEEKYLLAQSNFEQANLLIEEKNNQISLHELRIKSLESTESSFRTKVMHLKDEYENKKLLLDAIEREIESKRDQLNNINSTTLIAPTDSNNTGSIEIKAPSDISDPVTNILPDEEFIGIKLPKIDEQQLMDLIRQITEEDESFDDLD